MGDNLQTKAEKLIKYANAKFGTSENNLRSIIDNAVVGGGSSGEWQPNADMVWAKEVCENDVGPTECKLLQLIGDSDVTSNIYIPKYGYVKTSDGAFYENNTSTYTSVTHTWDDTNARASEGFKGIYEKVRYVITYYMENSPNVFPTTQEHNGYLRSVVYMCYNNINAVVSTTGFLNYLNSLVYFEGINNTTLVICDKAFYNCSSLKTIPNGMPLDKYYTCSYVFYNCTALEIVTPIQNLKNCTNYGYMFYGCYNLKTIGSIDLRSATNVKSIVNNCYSLVNITLKNIPISIQIGSGSMADTLGYGQMLTLKSLLNTIKEVLDNTEGASTKTLTVGSANLAKLANVYVKLIEITDDMRAEDEFIDKKFPFEVCESTDEGAMHIINDYLFLKNWEIK